MKSSKISKKCLVGYLAGAIFLVSCFVVQPLFAAQKFRMQSVFPASSGAYQGMKLFVEALKERSNGQLDITLYAPGALAKPLEVFDSVKLGVIDMGFSTGVYQASKLPEALIEFGLPFSFAGPMFSTIASNQFYDFFYDWRGGIIKNTLRELYTRHNIHLVGAHTSSSYGLMTNFPVERLDDFKGKKLRTFGLYSVLAKKMGAAPTSIPAAEQYIAMERGTVDGTIYPYYTLETTNLKEVVTHIVLPPPSPTPGLNFYVNKKKWASLSSEDQALIEKTYLEYAKIYTSDAISKEKAAIDAAIKVGAKVVTLPPEDVKRLKEMGRSTWPIIAKKSEKCAELIGLLKEYLTEKGIY
jgi:TRAP-type C4-dicarboxylate transport system substrate-binding protein